LKLLSTTQQVTRLSFLAAVGTALFVVESFIPTPFPFLKIGLANVSGLVALMVAGPASMFIVVVIRIVAGSLLVGSYLGPGFLLACAGGISSALAMALTKKFAGNLFSVIGISLIGSTVHVLAQYAVVVNVYVQSSSLQYVLPLLLVSALVGGLIVGWVSVTVLRVFDGDGKS
jgi:heptaprenyl diphosphate synthase